MRILAVDDDPIIRDLLDHALNQHDQYDLTCAKSAEEALDALKTDPEGFDCFLLDIMLPGIDGIELCDMIRKTNRHRTTPIIMITASREPDLMGRAFHAGATDFVCKPLNGVELGARINSAGMLNDSLRREQEAAHTLADLAAKTKLKFDEPIILKTAGVSDLLSLENDLLRLPEGLFPMNLLWIDIMGLRGVHQAVSATCFRAVLEKVSGAIAESLKGTPWKLAYAGSGRFAGLVMDRARPNREEMLDKINTKLKGSWEQSEMGTPMPPALRITPLSDQRLWSGRSASDYFRTNLSNRDLLSKPDEAQEVRLFDRFAREAGAS